MYVLCYTEIYIVFYSKYLDLRIIKSLFLKKILFSKQSGQCWLLQTLRITNKS